VSRSLREADEASKKQKRCGEDPDAVVQRVTVRRFRQAVEVLDRAVFERVRDPGCSLCVGVSRFDQDESVHGKQPKPDQQSDKHCSATGCEEPRSHCHQAIENVGSQRTDLPIGPPSGGVTTYRFHVIGAQDLVRVLAVAEACEAADGGIVFVTAIEIWDRKVVVHVAEQHPPTLRPRDFAEQDRLTWVLSDDVGTEYRAQGSHGSGPVEQVQRTFEFLGEIPATATTLVVAPGNVAGDKVVRVSLS
jgi:hypothetical protein